MSRAWTGPRRHGARIALALFVGAIAFLAFPRTAYRVPTLAAGQVAGTDVITPVRVVVLKDDVARAREAEMLASTIKPIIAVRREAAPAAAASARAFFARLDSAAAKGSAPGAVGRNAGIALSEEEQAMLSSTADRRRWEAALIRALAASASGYLAPGISEADLGRAVVLRDAGGERMVPADSVATFSDFLTRAGRVAPEHGAKPVRLFERLVGAFFQPTLVYEREETDRRRDALRRTVDSVETVLLAGQRIVGAHEIVTEAAVRQVEALRRTLGGGDAAAPAWLRFAGGLGLNILILVLLGIACLVMRPEVYRNSRSLSFVAAILAVTPVAAGALARNAPGHAELIPVAFPAFLLVILYDSRIAVAAAMALAALIGIQPALRGTDALFITFTGGVAAALSMRTITSRAQVYAAILAVTAFVAAAEALAGAAAGVPATRIAEAAALGGVNALACAALATLVLPLAEQITRVTTDLRLLELADPSRPLLRRLATEAPGTYAHSLAMANLCESACNAIGANGLLARVGCYYHDVGKLKRPQFFVENQVHGANPHAQLTAAQSGGVIRRHVADGLALAAEHRLPEAVARFIPEHHGTSSIAYFLERAREEKETVREDEFRYPGPAPRTAETAVALLADCIEAALRVLDEPTPETIRDAIDHLVGQRLEAGQLNDAPLTLADIEVVKREFVRVLTGMYHQRVEYPEETGGITSDWEPPDDA